MTEQTLSALVRSLYSQARFMVRFARCELIGGRPDTAIGALVYADQLRQRARRSRRWYVRPAAV